MQTLAQSQTKNQRILILNDNQSTHGYYRKILSTNKKSLESITQKWRPLDVEQPAEKITSPTEFNLEFSVRADEGIRKIERAVLDNNPFSVVFLDLQTPPGWGGIAAAKKIMEVDSYIQIVICSAFSGFSTDQILENVGHSKNVVILHKPFEPTEVEVLAVSLAQTWQAHDEYTRVTRCQSHTLSRASHLLEEIQQANQQLQSEKNDLNLSQIELSNLLEVTSNRLAETEKCGLFALQSVLVARHPEIGNQIPRVQAVAQRLAEQLALSGPYQSEIDDAYLDDFFQSTPLFDVGLVGIPDAVLEKKENLTESERLLFNQHTIIGYEILNTTTQRFPSSRFATMAYEIARHHHERWDGRGYPDRLSSNFIPLSARIVAVAIAFTSITDANRQTAKISEETVKEIMRMESGRQFDPYIVNAFLLAFPTIQNAI